MSAGVLSALICALWVAVCAAAPEFIWQGLKATLHHLSREDIIAALLIGLMLACFVEPAAERVRDVVLGAGGAPAHTARPRSPLFTAGLSLTFALASVSLHHAMTAFLSNHGGASGGEGGALVAGIRLAVAWAIVPFAVTLAWLGAGRTLLACTARDHRDCLAGHRGLVVRLAGALGDRHGAAVRLHSGPGIPARARTAAPHDVSPPGARGGRRGVRLARGRIAVRCGRESMDGSPASDL